MHRRSLGPKGLRSLPVHPGLGAVTQNPTHRRMASVPALGAEATRQLEKRARSVGSQKGCKKMQKAPVANPGHQIKHVKKRPVVEHTQAKFSPDGPWSSESESGAWSS